MTNDPLYDLDFHSWCAGARVASSKKDRIQALIARMSKVFLRLYSGNEPASNIQCRSEIWKCHWTTGILPVNGLEARGPAKK
jgi:hypothetical protein